MFHETPVRDTAPCAADAWLAPHALKRAARSQEQLRPHSRTARVDHKADHIQRISTALADFPRLDRHVKFGGDEAFYIAHCHYKIALRA